MSYSIRLQKIQIDHLKLCASSSTFFLKQRESISWKASRSLLWCCWFVCSATPRMAMHTSHLLWPLHVTHSSDFLMQLETEPTSSVDAPSDMTEFLCGCVCGKLSRASPRLLLYFRSIIYTFMMVLAPTQRAPQLTLHSCPSTKSCRCFRVSTHQALSQNAGHLGHGLFIWVLEIFAHFHTELGSAWKRLGNGGDRKVTPNVSFFFLATEA